MRTGNSIGRKSATEITTVGMPLEAGTLAAVSFQKIYTPWNCRHIANVIC